MIDLNAAKILDGALVERLNGEIEKAVGNCLDVNTEAKKTRTVTLKVKIRPDETRTFAHLGVEVSSSLCPLETLTTAIFMSQDAKTGEISAAETAPADVVEVKNAKIHSISN